MSQPARILLADDHAVLRSGLRLLLEKQPDFEVIGEASNGTEALERAAELHPDVILLDLNMPEMDGLTAIPKLRELAPNSRILILTMHDDASYLKQALQSGAAGYVLKRVVDTELLLALRAVLRGEVYVHSAMTQKLLDQVANPDAEPQDVDPWKGLSEREYEVLKRVALGYTNTEIAEDLFLSAKTVETYRARGMEKLNVETRAQLVKSALQHGHLD
ncbi:MAG: response regulator transcription factor [Anaerolineae bacterium]|nr:response regulator transcription factor [Anaerolineae bacterium]